jgi:hypothetical protein
MSLARRSYVIQVIGSEVQVMNDDELIMQMHVTLVLREFCEWAEQQEDGDKILWMLKQGDEMLVQVDAGAILCVEEVEEAIVQADWLYELALGQGFEDAMDIFDEARSRLRSYGLLKER